ncbi:MAG: tagaturonate epimerase family protein [Verrucomicrobiota bacterium]
MTEFLAMGKYSIGMGDRFGRQAQAQLRACIRAAAEGVDVVPVWNKSNREHVIIGSEPRQSRAAAEAAVKALKWNKPYFVDADHIGLETVERYLPHADFFTIDVAEWIGQAAPAEAGRRFVERHGELAGETGAPGIGRPIEMERAGVERIVNKYYLAAREAGKIYRRIAQAKGAGNFVTEVSMDETDTAQTPAELLVILAALGDEGIPLQTIAPKFTGRFNKGVDYDGDVEQFEKEFKEDLAVIGLAVKQYGFPPGLKLSVHSGSDKFSIYGPIRRALRQFGAGVHVKTAGTTWLEEVIGLASAGGEGLAVAQDVYAGALEHIDELCGPYAAVLDIDRGKLPSAATVRGWSAEQFVAAVRHDEKNPAYNRHARQLLHVGYKIAAKMGRRYLNALEEYKETVGRNVAENLYERHIKPLYLAKD